MKRYVFGFVMLSALAGVVFAQDKKADAEVKKLEGTWEIVAAEMLGKKTEPPKGKGGSIVFEKGMKFVMKEENGNPVKHGKYKIDPGKSPKQLDLIGLTDEKDGQVLQAIYEVNGDTLRLAASGEGAKKGKRPTEFKGEKVFILHLKRQKS